MEQKTMDDAVPIVSAHATLYRFPLATDTSVANHSCWSGGSKGEVSLRMYANNTKTAIQFVPASTEFFTHQIHPSEQPNGLNAWLHKAAVVTWKEGNPLCVVIGKFAPFSYVNKNGKAN